MRRKNRRVFTIAALSWSKEKLQKFQERYLKTLPTKKPSKGFTKQNSYNYKDMYRFMNNDMDSAIPSLSSIEYRNVLTEYNKIVFELAMVEGRPLKAYIGTFFCMRVKGYSPYMRKIIYNNVGDKKRFINDHSKHYIYQFKWRRFRKITGFVKFYKFRLSKFARRDIKTWALDNRITSIIFYSPTRKRYGADY